MKKRILDETEKRIIELLIEGYEQKEIAHKTWKSIGAINQRVRSLRIKYNCKTTEELITKLTELA